MNLPVRYTTTFGPNFDTLFPHVKMSYRNNEIYPSDTIVTLENLANLAEILEPELLAFINRSQQVTFIELLELLITALHQIKGEIQVAIKRSDTLGETSLFVEYVNEICTKEILSLALLITILTKRKLNVITQDIKHYIAAQFKKIKLISPSKVNINLFSAAKELSIPRYLIPSSTNTYCYGQGQKGYLLDAGLSQGDSKIGFDLQFNKLRTTSLLNALGYPGTEQVSVTSPEEANRALKTIGFPLVVKPSDEGKGLGVSANITNEEEFRTALRNTRKVTRGAIVVEKFIEGDDHRITVFQGKITGIIRRRAPNVVGDGMHTIRDLIDNKNKTIKEQLLTGNILQETVIDDLLLATLSKQSLTLESIPPKGKLIPFRSNANFSTGGEVKIIELHEAHPDNLAMAINIVNAFRLDSVGIDFITPDISKSWQEKGTIIEINNYAMQTDRLAKRLLQKQFPSSEDSRIKLILIISNDIEFQMSFSPMKTNNFKNKGFTNNQSSSISGMKLKLDNRSLHHRCFAFMINPACEELTVATNFLEIEQNGLPLDFFSDCVVDKKSMANHQFLRRSSDEFISWLNQFVNNLQIK